MRVDGAAVGEPDGAGRPVHLDTDHVPGGDHLGAELDRLPPRPLGQLRPGHPVREAQVVLDPGTLPGLAAGGGALDQHRPQSLGRAVDRGAEAGRAGADHHDVVEVLGRCGAQPDLVGELGVRRLDQHLAVGGDHHRQLGVVHAGRGQQPVALRLVGEVRVVRHLIAGQEVPHLAGSGRPAVPDQLGLRHLPVVGVRPFLELLVDDRVELLLRRIPRLEQVVVQIDDVDRVDRGVGVGVGGQQHPARGRVDVHRLFQELDPVHLRHPVVGEQHRDVIAAELHLLQRVERVGAGLGADDPVVLAVATAQVAGHRPGHAGVVVDGEDRRLGLGLGFCVCRHHTSFTPHRNRVPSAPRQPGRRARFSSLTR